VQIDVEDYELVAEYIDAIRQLTASAGSDKAVWADIKRLSDHVVDIQRRIETEVGQREPSVRELFRTASHLATFRYPRNRGRNSVGPAPGGRAARRQASPDPHPPADEHV
jgi:hypothetical protein